MQISFYALSADDFYRAMLALDVLRGHIIPTIYWPPLHFWLGALTVRITGSVLSAPLLLNLLCSAGCAWLLYDFSKQLRLKVRPVFFVIFLFSTPYFYLLGVSGLSEPSYFFFLILAYNGLARWQSGQKSGIWIAAAGFLFASMIRFDAWSHSMVFSSIIGIRVVFRRSLHWKYLAGAAIPYLFLALWMIYNYYEAGDPLYFFKSNRDYFFLMKGEMNRFGLIWTRFFDFLIAAVFVLPFLPAIVRRFRFYSILSVMWIFSFLILVLSAGNGNLPLHNPVRVMLAHSILLIPFALAVLLEMKNIYLKRIFAACLAVAAVFQITLPFYYSYPTGLDPDIEDASRFLGAILATDASQVLVEKKHANVWAVRAVSGYPDCCLAVDRSEIEKRGLSRIVREKKTGYILYFGDIPAKASGIRTASIYHRGEITILRVQ